MRIEDIPLKYSSFDKEDWDYFNDKISGMTKDNLIVELIQTIDESCALKAKIIDWWKRSNLDILTSDLKIEYNTDTRDIVEWLYLLERVATEAEKAISVDKLAMSRLASVDPGAYAQVVISRRQFRRPKDPESFLFKSDLAKFANQQVLGTTLVVDDHKSWHHYVEGYDYTNRTKRLMPNFNTLMAPSTHYYQEDFFHEGESAAYCTHEMEIS